VGAGRSREGCWDCFVPVGSGVDDGTDDGTDVGVAEEGTVEFKTDLCLLLRLCLA
jgi:hypothetical protein